MIMESMVTTEEDGTSQVHVGITICEGPGRYRMVLTRPFSAQGQIIEIPVEEIESIETVEATPLGQEPQPAV